MIAALFVETDGCYFGLPDVDPWDIRRDARLYGGPWPVVAHPPCKRWGRYATGAPLDNSRYLVGDDEGCFASALASVRLYAGVLEHPAYSHAWSWFGLQKPPKDGGWVPADDRGGFTCHVEQGAYGHKARKATWLYANGISLLDLKWGKAEGDFVRLDARYHIAEERKRAVKTGACQQLSKRQRAATPIEFRDLLLSLVR